MPARRHSLLALLVLVRGWAQSSGHPSKLLIFISFVRCVGRLLRRGVGSALYPPRATRFSAAVLCQRDGNDLAYPTIHALADRRGESALWIHTQGEHVC